MHSCTLKDSTNIDDRRKCLYILDIKMKPMCLLSFVFNRLFLNVLNSYSMLMKSRKTNFTKCFLAGNKHFFI